MGNGASQTLPGRKAVAFGVGSKNWNSQNPYLTGNSSAYATQASNNAYSTTGSMGVSALKHSQRHVSSRRVKDNDSNRLSTFFLELLEDATLFNCFRQYLATEHFTEHLALFWASANKLMIKCKELLHSTDKENIESELVFLIQQCDDLFAKYISPEATYSVHIWVDEESREEILKCVGVLKVVLEGMSSAKDPTLPGAGEGGPEFKASIRMTISALASAQRKVFNTMLYDYLPLFILSDKLTNGSKNTITSIKDLRHTLKQGIHHANVAKSSKHPEEVIKAGNTASILLRNIVADPSCSYYLETYLSKVATKLSATHKQIEDASGTGLKWSLGLLPDQLISCLLEMEDFTLVSTYEAKKNRSQLLVKRYGSEDQGCDVLIELAKQKDAVLDDEQCDALHIQLSVRFLTEFGHGFLESDEFEELERALASSLAPGHSDPSTRLAHLREYVHSKLNVAPKHHERRSSEMCLDDLEAREMQNAAVRSSENILASLEGVLSIPLGYGLFRRFSITQFQEENICFYLEVLHYKSGHYLAPPNGTAIFNDRTLGKQGGITLSEMRLLRAIHIRDKYIMVGSRRQINIGSAMRELTIEGCEPPPEHPPDTPWQPALTVFDAAAAEIMKLMKNNLWCKFIVSPLYESLKRQLYKHDAIGLMIAAGQISTALVQGVAQPGGWNGRPP